MLNVNDHSPTLDLARVAVHLTSIHHQATLVATRPRHDPLPQYTMDTVGQNAQDVNPGLVGEKVPDEAAAGAGEEVLVGLLKLIPEDGFLAIAPVDMAEDVETRFHAPNFAEEVAASETEVAVVKLGGGVSEM
jgi:hypothetical protein